MRVGTYNVLIPRDDRPNRTEESWDHRKSAVVDTIDSSFDLVGLQECSTLPAHNQASYLVKELSNRGWESYLPWEHKLFPDEFSERLPIFWRPEFFAFIEAGQILLSSWTEEELSEVPILEARYASFVKLRTINGSILWFYTLHLQHETRNGSLREKAVAEAKRAESQSRVADHILAHTKVGDTVILGGDFNTTKPSKIHLSLVNLEDVFQSAVSSKNSDHNSFHDWKGLQEGEHIDHLFCSGSGSVMQAEIVLRNASDHYPVRAILDIG